MNSQLAGPYTVAEGWFMKGRPGGASGYARPVVWKRLEWANELEARATLREPTVAYAIDLCKVTLG